MTADLSDSEKGRMFMVEGAWLSPASKMVGFNVHVDKFTVYESGIRSVRFSASGAAGA